MPLLYSVVSKGSEVLLEASNPSRPGNFAIVCRKILARSHPEPQLTYVYDEFHFHLLQKQSLTFLTVSDETFAANEPFAYLENISSNFFQQFTAPFEIDPLNADARQFETYMRDQMSSFLGGKATSSQFATPASSSSTIAQNSNVSIPVAAAVSSVQTEPEVPKVQPTRAVLQNQITDSLSVRLR